jgi:predicted DNA-binding transcriptional regulator AlpA
MGRTHTPASAADTDRDRLFARMPTVIRLTGLGRSTICRLMAEDRSSQQVNRAVVFELFDTLFWLNQ